MRHGYFHFVREIYKYCDENKGQKVLLPVFVNLWDEDCPKSRTDLTVMTSKIISRLLHKGILIEIPKSERFHVPYGLYKILNYEENLVREDDIGQKRTRLFK